MADNFSIDLKNLKIAPQEDKPITKSANDERYITRLRDCFNAGYQMPQYCIDNNIKKPLFVGVNESQQNFLWEIFAQFKYSKRTDIQPKFALLSAGQKTTITPIIASFYQPALDIFADL